VETPYDLAQAPPGPPQQLSATAAFAGRWALPPLVWRIARFLAVGLVGLAVDASLFSILYAHGAAAPIARAISLICATVVTWALNRVVTFEPSGREALHEALRYGIVALLAQGFNYASFLTLLHVTGATHPLRTLVATAVVTAGFSFTGQSLFAFRRRAMRPFNFKR
jgi:putative flippase GtrA